MVTRHAVASAPHEGAPGSAPGRDAVESAVVASLAAAKMVPHAESVPSANAVRAESTHSARRASESEIPPMSAGVVPLSPQSPPSVGRMAAWPNTARPATTKTATAAVRRHQAPPARASADCAPPQSPPDGWSCGGGVSSTLHALSRLVASRPFRFEYASKTARTLVPLRTRSMVTAPLALSRTRTRTNAAGRSRSLPGHSETCDETDMREETTEASSSEGAMGRGISFQLDLRKYP
mmetsp:Transcript_6406/g.22796  ORF Transcript_6406/g.22796 Transcript_6406/m.22796 type:complete len:237 (+) Transcript_6406:561-1271(+)